MRPETLDQDSQAHWNRVYKDKAPSNVSWYQPTPVTSMRFIQKLTSPSARIVDVGAGASTLVDALLTSGYARPICLDISVAALEHSQARLGEDARRVEWIVADVTRDPALPDVDLWHDRAVLHFLVEPGQQDAYARLAARTVRPGGHVVIATFAPDGPDRCSGLPVQRHDGRSVAALLGTRFELLEEEREVHRTPNGVEQRLCWSVLRRLGLP
jgi:SAM-dependent methyltransferase